jgi:hypothetical protein
VEAHDGVFDQTYSTNIKTKPNTLHCFDFFYYITGAINDAKISVGWQSGEMKTTIVEVTALADNKWQHNRTTYMSSSSDMNQV